MDRKLIERALDLYFEELKSNKKLQNLLEEKGINSFKNLREKKAESILEIYRKGITDDIKNKFVAIGKLHFDLGISHVEFLDAFDKIKCYLNRILIQENKLDYRSYTKNVEVFKKAKDYVSLGYLYKYIHQDKRTLQLLYEKEKETDIVKNFIITHILWLISILNGLESMKLNQVRPISQKECEFSWFLRSKDIKDILSKEDLNLIEYLHNIVHNNADDIFYQFEKEEYAKLLNSYVSFIRNSLALLNLLASLVIQENIWKVKIDPLTGLFNRRTMDEILEHNLKIAQIAEEPFTVAMVDIDNFKSINDRYGHIVGDCILKQLAILMKKNLRKSDFVFRYGGEEFLIFLPATKLKDSVYVMEKLRKTIEKTAFICDNHQINITVSIGVESVIPDEKTKVIDIIREADKKLYEAKRTGKNKTVF